MFFNLLKPSGGFTYDVVPTLRLCVLYGSQNKQQILAYNPLKTKHICFIYEELVRTAQ
jgi:hypothetical protein